MMKLWLMMMVCMIVLMACFLYARDVGLQYKGLIEEFERCVEYHDGDYETCSDIMTSDMKQVDWLDNQWK